MFFKNKQIVFPLFLLFLHPQKKFPGPPITKERSRVAGTGYVRGFRSNNQSKVRLRLCTVLEQLLAANPQISEAQKNVSLLMQKIQKRVQMARVVFIKFAQQIVMLGLVRVPYRTFPQRKKHGASHFVGVDKGNKFMWLFRITQTHDGGLKVCAQACARRFGFCYPSSGELWTRNGWNSLQQPCMCCF